MVAKRRYRGTAQLGAGILSITETSCFTAVSASYPRLDLCPQLTIEVSIYVGLAR